MKPYRPKATPKKCPKCAASWPNYRSCECATARKRCAACGKCSKCGARKRAQPTSVYRVPFRDHRGELRELSAFTDRSASEKLARRCERLASTVAVGERPDAEQARWIEGLPAKMRDKLVGWGLIDARTSAASKPLAVLDDKGRLIGGHLHDWGEALLGKGNVARDMRQKVERARLVFEGAGACLWADIDPTKVESYLASIREGGDGLSAQTRNNYVGSAKQFARWMVANRRAAENPIGHLKAINVKADRRHDRQALTADKLARLIRAAEIGPPPKRKGGKLPGPVECYGVSGPERALIYRIAASTGLRANELRTLTRASFDLDPAAPKVTVGAAYSKHRRRDVLPIRRELIEPLRSHLEGKHPSARALRVPDDPAMMRGDLADARAWWLLEAEDALVRAKREASDFLAYRDHEGLYADFHSLRHSFGSMLAASGVHPKVAQTLMRHSTITLTMDRYSHLGDDDQRSALASLPPIDDGGAEPLQATGTDGRLAAGLGSGLPSGCAPVRPVAVGAPADGGKNAIRGRHSDLASQSGI